MRAIVRMYTIIAKTLANTRPYHTPLAFSGKRYRNNLDEIGEANKTKRHVKTTRANKMCCVCLCVFVCMCCVCVVF